MMAGHLGSGLGRNGTLRGSIGSGHGMILKWTTARAVTTRTVAIDEDEAYSAA